MGLAFLDDSYNCRLGDYIGTSSFIGGDRDKPRRLHACPLCKQDIPFIVRYEMKEFKKEYGVELVKCAGCDKLFPPKEIRWVKVAYSSWREQDEYSCPTYNVLLCRTCSKTGISRQGGGNAQGL